MCDDSMTKILKPDEVISLITKKVQIKKDLRELRKNKEDRKADILQLKLEQLDDKLHSRPLAKN